MQSDIIRATIISAIITVVFALFSGFPLYPSLSFTVFIIAFYTFASRLGHIIPFRELAFLVAALQLLVSSFLAFYIQKPDEIFLPKISPDQYFHYAIPGIILFGMGLFTFRPKHDLIELFERFQYLDLFAIAKKLILVGYLSLFIDPFMPGGLSYFFTLLVFLSYIGGIGVLFSNISQNRKPAWIILAFLPVVRDAFFSGIFYLALIWMAFLFLFMMLKAPRISFSGKIIIITVGLFLTLTLDGAKKDYREITWERESNYSFFERTALLTRLTWERLTLQYFFSDQNLSARITRANQGALVTWVMDYVPENEPFAKGATVKEAIETAILPRILFPGKARAGGNNFERFTGHKLQGTSMNISLLGEGWANYGYWGGLIFMYAVGAFYSLTFKWFSKLFSRYPLYFFFIPFLFLYTIKAEDDLMTPLNHFIKAGIVLVILHHIWLKRYKIIDHQN